MLSKNHNDHIYINGSSYKEKEPEIRNHINKSVDSITSFARIEPRENPTLQKIENRDCSVTDNAKWKSLEGRVHTSQLK